MEGQHDPDPAPAEYDGWRAVVSDGLDQLGWLAHARIEQPAEDVTLVIVDAPLEKDITIDLAGPTTFSLSVFLEGAGILSATGLPTVEISSGTGVLFASRGQISGIDTLYGGRRFRIVDIRFEESFLLRAGVGELGPSGVSLLEAVEPGSDRVFLAGFPASRRLTQIATEILDSVAADTLAKRLVMQGKAIEALGAAIETLNGAAQPKALRPHVRTKIERARSIVENEYARDWTITGLAREVGLGEKQLKVGFRDVVGRPVHAHLTAARLDAAARHLDGGMSVTEAALATGFGNLSHFSKVFREAKGVSPSLYARRR